MAWVAILATLASQGASEERWRGAELSEPVDALQRTITDMPYGSVEHSELIGNTGNQLGRRWLIRDLAHGEVLLLKVSYPRFVPYGNQRFAPGSWENDLPFVVDPNGEYADLFGHVFPRWRATQGQLAFFCAQGFRTFSMNINYGGGFFLTPYRPDVPDYRYPWGELTAMKPEDAERFAQREANSKRELATAAYMFNSTPDSPIFDDHRLALGLHDQACAGLDFAIKEDGTGFFFLIERMNHVRRVRGESIKAPDPEDLPSKMVVLNYRMQDQEEWIPKLDRDDKPVASEPKTTPRAPSRPKPAVGRNDDEIVVGLDAPGVFGACFRRFLEPPDSVVSLKWTEKESFTAPFSVPFTAAVDGDCYFFVTNGGRIYRASPGEPEGAERTVERVFDNADDPVIACIHESATNRIFAFRRNSYLPVDNAHFTEPGSPHFVPCEDVMRPKAMTYMEEDGTLKTPDKRFQLVSRCAGVLYRDGVLDRIKGTGAYTE